MNNVKDRNNLIVLPGNLPHGGKPRPSLQSQIHPDAETATGPNYAGRMIAINPQSKQKRFQCGGFYLGPPKLLSAVVPPDAQMEPIQAAILAGTLIDITDHDEIQIGGSRLETVHESDTDKKLYFLTHPELGPVVFGTNDAKVKASLDAQLEAQVENGMSSLVLPPGYEDIDKYLLPVDKATPAPEPVAETPALLKDRLKTALHRLVEKL